MMKTLFGRAAVLCLLLLSACATKGSRAALVLAETTFNNEAGERNWLYVTLRLNGAEEALFNVDTGSPVTVLDKSLAEQLGEPIGQTTIRASFGGVTYSNLFVDRSPEIKGPHGSAYLNAIGLPFLARHVVTLNFPKRTMYLSPTIYRRSDEVGFTGVRSIQSRSKLLLHSAASDLMRT